MWAGVRVGAIAISISACGGSSAPQYQVKEETVTLAVPPAIDCDAFVERRAPRAPPSGRPPPLPGPLAPVVVAPQLVEGHRVFGSPRIYPSAAVRAAMQDAHTERMIASVKICMTASGVVDGLTLVKSSGFAGYDHQLCEAMRTWLYDPWTVDGRPVPVCTAITFIFGHS